MATNSSSRSILFGGDLMLGRGVNKVINEHGPEHPLKPLHDVTRAADFTFVNLECAISNTEQTFQGAPKAFYFRADPLAVNTLTSAGIDAVSLANNHALDAGVIGLEDTLDHLQQAGVAAAGAGLDQSHAAAPAYLEDSDIRIGMLAACDHQADFAAGNEQPGIQHLDLRAGQGARLVEAVRQLQVDLIVVALHWQPNYAPEVPPGYRQLAADLVEAGADVVWGHSPHHFQGVEWLGDSPVIYAAGDLVDDYALDERYRNDLGLLFEVRLSDDRPETLRALPLKLGFGQTGRAQGEDRVWIEQRFSEFCGDVGSSVRADGEWLQVPKG